MVPITVTVASTTRPRPASISGTALRDSAMRAATASNAGAATATVSDWTRSCRYPIDGSPSRSGEGVLCQSPESVETVLCHFGPELGS